MGSEKSTPTERGSLGTCNLKGPEPHLDEKFQCMGDNCNIRPDLCHNCAYLIDEEKGTYTCKLCKVTENMKSFDPDDLDIDTDASSHNIVCVASVSFDR